MPTRSLFILSVCAVTLLRPSAAVSQDAQTPPALKTLVQFVGTNGSDAVSEPIQLPNSNFFGVTLHPSYAKKVPSTVYELEPGGVIQNLYQLAADGSQGEILNGCCVPNQGLVQATDGKIYGIMLDGGKTPGYGLVYRFTLPNKFEVLHNFSITDGAGPVGKLTQALDGNLYGVASSGGSNSGGTLFRVGLDGSFTTLYNFSGLDGLGVFPESGLVAHPNGMLYGTLSQTLPAVGGDIYELDPKSGKVQLFAAGPIDTSTPPVIGLDGGLYFLSYPSASCPGCSGSLVRYGVDGSGPTDVYDFNTSKLPTVYACPLMQASDGKFYGGCNPMFRLDIESQTLDLLTPPLNAPHPLAGNLVEGSGGSLIGAFPMTSHSPLLGFLVALTPSLPKPQPSILGFFPTTVSAGDTVSLLGNYFVGATGVSVNGVAATFVIKGSGAIQFTVPANATSGAVAIFNQGGSSVSSSVLTIK